MASTLRESNDTMYVAYLPAGLDMLNELFPRVGRVIFSEGVVRFVLTPYHGLSWQPAMSNPAYGPGGHERRRGLLRTAP